MKGRMQIDKIGEFALIERLARILPKVPKGVLGIGDDTAVLPFSKDKHLLFTTDMMAQDVHFTMRMDPEGIGHKALACNISDIAAMGGKPTYAVVSIAMPAKTDVKFIEGVYKGLARTAKAFKVSIVGGDSIKADKIIINVALLGEVSKKHLVMRSGAQPGDWVFVSGPLGGSFNSGHHLSFTPCVKEAQFLIKNFKPSAMMDISDGLAGDLNHILRSSGVGVKLWPEAVPVYRGCTYEQALGDGEDYELLFTLSPKKAVKLMQWQIKKHVFMFYPIGEIIADKKQRVNVKSFTHY